MKKILFISPYSFKQINGGSILFKELFNSLKDLSISWFITSERFVKTIIDYEFKSITSFNELIFKIPIFNKIARRISFLGGPFFVIKYRLISVYATKKAISIIKKENINFLWVYASHSSIPIAKQLYNRTGIKYHLSIQDDIHTHLPKFEARLLEYDFKLLIENATSIDFISKEMNDYYNKVYTIKAKSINVILGHQVKIEKPILSKNITKIGYAGNIWCGENFKILLDGIRDFDRLTNKSIRLHIYSNSKPKVLSRKYSNYIVFHKTLEYKELIKELQSCDLLYLPMSFLPSKRITNITSFPSKIITYLNTHIPLLNHSPENAVSHKFVLENKVGYSLVHGNKAEIIDFFVHNKSLNDIEYRKFYSRNTISALKKFDNIKMCNQLHELLK